MNASVVSLGAAAESAIKGRGPVQEAIEKLEQMLQLARDGQIQAFAAAVVGPFAREPMLYAQSRAETLQLIGSIEVAKSYLVLLEVDDIVAEDDTD